MENFEYKKSSITSVLQTAAAVAVGLGGVYYAFIATNMESGTVLYIIKAVAALWTIYFAYSLFNDVKNLSAPDMAVSVGPDKLVIDEDQITWDSFNYGKITPTSGDGTSEMFMYGFDKSPGSEKRESLDSDCFSSKSDFDRFVDLVKQYSGKEISNVMD